jgi:hypothetical protein
VWDPPPNPEELKVPVGWVTNTTSGLGPLLIRISGIDVVTPPSDGRQPCLCASANGTFFVPPNAPPVGNGCVWDGAFSLTVCTSEGHNHPLNISVGGRLNYGSSPDRFTFSGSFGFNSQADGAGGGTGAIVGGSFSFLSSAIPKNSVLDLTTWNTIPYFSGAYFNTTVAGYPTQCGSAVPVFEVMAG